MLTLSDLADRSEELWNQLPEEIAPHIALRDAWGLSAETRIAKYHHEALRRGRLARLLADGYDLDVGRVVWTPDQIAERRQEFHDACASDPVFFIENCIWTRDPERRVALHTELPKLLFRYEKDLWITPWKQSLNLSPGERSKIVHDKSRRMSMSIDRIAFELWCFRFVPGSSAWVATDQDETLDGGDDWNSLLGKFRYFWLRCRGAYPWLFPHLPPQSSVNKHKYLRFPDWVEGGIRQAESCWRNELRGYLPSEVAGRGGAASRGFVDEGGWIEKLQKFRDSMEDMTPNLTYASSPSADRANIFAVLRYDTPGVQANSAWWCTAANPILCEGVYWSKSGEEGYQAGKSRGPHTRQWRSYHYNQASKGRTSEEMARNWDGDYAASAGKRVFLTYSPEQNHSDTYDLYNPNLPLAWWCDVGGGDLWAWVAVQWSDITGEINIVDYFSDDDKTVQFFIPIIDGWDHKQKHRWRCAPSRAPWFREVPYLYEDYDLVRMEYWAGKLRPKYIVYDFTGNRRNAISYNTLDNILKAYSYRTRALPMQHHREEFIEHANEVLNRVRISQRLIGVRPRGRDPSIDEVLQYWRRLDSTEAGRMAIPKHDVYCLDEDTEILTKRGFVSIDTFEEQDQVANFCREVMAITGYETKRWFVYPEEIREMVLLSGQSISQCLTLNHTVLYEMRGGQDGKKTRVEIEPAEALFKYQHTKFIKIPTESPAAFSDCKQTDDEIRFMGWMITEGSKCRDLRQDTYTYRLCQCAEHNPIYVEEIDGVLKRLGLDFHRARVKGRPMINWTIRKSSHSRVEELLPGGVHEIPREFLTAASSRQCLLLLETLMKGDGHTPKEGDKSYTKTRRYSTMRESLAKDVQELAARCGIRSRIATYRTSQGTTMYHVSLHYGKRGSVQSLERISYTGRLWCAESRTGFLVIRRNGIISVTGNSHGGTAILYGCQFLKAQMHGIARPGDEPHSRRQVIVPPKPRAYTAPYSNQGWMI